MNYQYSFKVGRKTIPYYHFKYVKEFKEVLRIKKLQKQSNVNRYYFEDGTYLPQFLSQETQKQFNFQSNYVTFDRVMFIIIHWFSDFIPKDLDNYNYKPFIDVFRRMKVIQDDSWRQVGVMNLGEYSEEESIDLYIIPYQYFINFISKKLKSFFDGEYEITTIDEIKRREELEKSFFPVEGFF